MFPVCLAYFSTMSTSEWSFRLLHKIYLLSSVKCSLPIRSRFIIYKGELKLSSPLKCQMWNKTRGNGKKLHQGKFKIDIRKSSSLRGWSVIGRDSLGNLDLWSQYQVYQSSRNICMTLSHTVYFK